MRFGWSLNPAAESDLTLKWYTHEAFGRMLLREGAEARVKKERGCSPVDGQRMHDRSNFSQYRIRGRSELGIAAPVHDECCKYACADPMAAQADEEEENEV